MGDLEPSVIIYVISFIQYPVDNHNGGVHLPGGGGGGGNSHMKGAGMPVGSFVLNF